MNDIFIQSPDQPELSQLRQRLIDQPLSPDERQQWIAGQLATCAQYGVFRWFVPQSLGGLGWSEPDVIRGYLALASACLTTTFVMTQWTAAVKRILASSNRSLAERLVPDLLSGKQFTTVGISHLTTSRQHLDRPAVTARPARGGGYILDGFSPWVTGAPLADVLVVGATTDDGAQLLLALPMDTAGVDVGPSHPLVALSASLTGPVQFQQVLVSAEHIVAGPEPQILGGGSGARTGGLQTSTLALGLARAAVEYLGTQAEARFHLTDSRDSLDQSLQELTDILLSAAQGNPLISNDLLRSRQQPGAAGDPGGSGGGQGRRVCAGPPGRPLVSGSPVLSGLELPPGRAKRKLV